MAHPKRAIVMTLPELHLQLVPCHLQNRKKPHKTSSKTSCNSGELNSVTKKAGRRRFYLTLLRSRTKERPTSL